MSRTAIEAFEQIAINQPPCCGWHTLNALLRKGVVTRGPDETRRDKLGVYSVPHFTVPLAIHMQWCEWASEQPDYVVLL